MQNSFFALNYFPAKIRLLDSTRKLLHSDVALRRSCSLWFFYFIFFLSSVLNFRIWGHWVKDFYCQETSQIYLDTPRRRIPEDCATERNATANFLHVSTVEISAIPLVGGAVAEWFNRLLCAQSSLWLKPWVGFLLFLCWAKYSSSQQTAIGEARVQTR